MKISQEKIEATGLQNLRDQKSLIHKTTIIVLTYRDMYKWLRIENHTIQINHCRPLFLAGEEKMIQGIFSASR